MTGDEAKPIDVGEIRLLAEVELEAIASGEAVFKGPCQGRTARLLHVQEEKGSLHRLAA
jgi:hypothetical protein